MCPVHVSESSPVGDQCLDRRLDLFLICTEHLTLIITNFNRLIKHITTLESGSKFLYNIKTLSNNFFYLNNIKTKFYCLLGLFLLQDRTVSLFFLPCHLPHYHCRCSICTIFLLQKEIYLENVHAVLHCQICLFVYYGVLFNLLCAFESNRGRRSGTTGHKDKDLNTRGEANSK